MRITGRVASPAATELSGLVVSTARRGVLWSLNDSGNARACSRFTTTGRRVAEVAVAGAVNVDWEDIAAGPARHAARRRHRRQPRPAPLDRRLPRPEPLAGGTVAPAARYELRYPDGGRDAEALLFDRTSGTIVIVTKSFGRRRAASTSRGGRRRAASPRCAAPGRSTSAGRGGDRRRRSADGRTIVLRTYDRAFAWRRRAGESVAARCAGGPAASDAALLAEGQGEALALTRDGRAFHTVPEGTEPALRRYETSAGVS